MWYVNYSKYKQGENHRYCFILTMWYVNYSVTGSTGGYGLMVLY